MNKPTLVVMAAGMGSRYGGLKQIEPIGPNGELIIEYSIFDAIKAGFGKIVFIIKKEMVDIFKEVIGNKIENIVKVEYVLQDIKNVPEDFNIPDERVKPWGTGHAVLCCKDIIKEPFAVINADDYYGQETYQIMSNYLMDNNRSTSYAMAGFILEKTLTEAGTVARGICTLDEENNLVSVEERTQIKRIGDKTKYTLDSEEWVEIPEGSIVSMNLWGFTPAIFDELEEGFIEFLHEINLGKKDILKAEYYLPVLVNDLLSAKKEKVKVLETSEQWFGVTYKEDTENVKEEMGKLMGNKYPNRLWEEFI